jgi:hypothetical protein
MLCKVTLGVLKGASKLNVLLLLFMIHKSVVRLLQDQHTPRIYMQEKEDSRWSQKSRRGTE